MNINNNLQFVFDSRPSNTRVPLSRPYFYLPIDNTARDPTGNMFIPYLSNKLFIDN